MILQLTSAGRALIDLDPVGAPVTSVVFGDGFNYTVDPAPTALVGDVVYTSNLEVLPVIISNVSIRYAIQLPSSVASFQFGEVALYSGATLLGIASNPTLISKSGPGMGSDGRPLKISFFVDLLEGQRYALGDFSGDAGGKSFPRLPVPDLLEPPAKNENNGYIIYGLTESDLPYFAFADPTGKWSFSNKPAVHFQGTVDSASGTGMQAASFSGSYSGNVNDLVLQFTSGELRGYCRICTNVTEGGAIQWNTPFTDGPTPGDAFIIVGPQAAGHPSIDFQDEGYSVGYIGQLDTVDFVGEGVSAYRSGNKVVVQIPGGGGGGGGTSQPYLASFSGNTTGTMNRSGFNDWVLTEQAPTDFVSWSDINDAFNFTEAGIYRVSVEARFDEEGYLALGLTQYGTMFGGQLKTQHSSTPTSESTWLGTEKFSSWTDVFVVQVYSAGLQTLELFVDNYTNAGNQVSFQAKVMIEKLTPGPFDPPPV